ncbi:MAG TPA: cupredoxin domain-containing protein [Gaiellaceae bacterium]|nr:cupredoxin domain-containing protein [Gaiellaceae bacterium]
MKRLIALAILALALAVPAAAAASTTLRISASPTALRYSTSRLTAHPGLVTILMTNRSPLRHDIEVKGHGVLAKGKIVGKGGVSRVSVRLKAGTYTFLCTVDSHAAAGMKGTLVVK